MSSIFDKLKSWKNKSKEKRVNIKKLEKQVRDLEKSRNNWKEKAQKKDRIISGLRDELKKNP
jgi:hypothetical protein